LRSINNIIVIDSNFILLPFQFKLDYFDEIRLNIEGNLKFVVFQQILNELESKRKREANNSNYTRFLKSGLEFLEKNKKNYDIEFFDNVKKSSETTDEFLLRMLMNLKQETQNVYLATNDSDLRKKAKMVSINTIFLRQKKYLSIDRA
jgi:rRNA-processing protein FCF1